MNDLAVLAERNGRFADYSGAWAVLPQEGEILRQFAEKADWTGHFRAMEDDDADYAPPREDAYEVRDGVAVLHLSGYMMKPVMSFPGMGTSTVFLRRQLRHAAGNAAVRSILLMVDSPGGTVAGTADLAEDVRRVSALKPVVAYVEDLCASAAYWVASQASAVYTNATALVGSIGTYVVVNDTSKMHEMEGIKTHLVRAGKFKGAGAPGVPVSDEELAKFQEVVDTLNGFFTGAVGAGRRLSAEAVEAVADGSVMIAAAAAAAGLTDGVRTIDEVFTAAVAASGNIKTSRVKEKAMDLSTLTEAALRQGNSGLVEQIAGAATKAERERAAAILKACGDLKVNHSAAAAHIQSGVSAEGARAALAETALAALRAEAPKAVAANGEPAAGAPAKAKAPQTPEGWKAEWEGSEALQREFISGEAYAKFREMEAAGRVNYKSTANAE